MTCGSNTDYFVILRTHGTNFYRKIKQIILAGQYASRKYSEMRKERDDSYLILSDLEIV